MGIHVICNTENKKRQSNSYKNANTISTNNNPSTSHDNEELDTNNPDDNSKDLEACQIVLDGMIKNEIQLQKEIKELENENQKLNEEKKRLENIINENNREF